jgi:hypothetical protein
VKRSEILSPRAGQVREFVSSMTGAMLGRALSRGKRATVRGWTAFVVLLGVTWLVLEFALRGGESPIRVDWVISGAVAATGALVGLAARARMSLRGEMSVSGEFALFVLLVVSILPAMMLLVYGGALVASAGVVSLSWTVWGVAFALAILLQLAIYAGIIAAFVALISEIMAALAVVAAYVVVMSFIAGAITDHWADAWNFALPRWAFERKEMIPEWTFAVRALRRSLAPLDHGRLMSIVASISAGAAAGLFLSIVLRFARQRLMRRTSLRGWLPMAAAPLPDSTTLVARPMVAPLVVYAVVAWSILLVWKVL